MRDALRAGDEVLTIGTMDPCSNSHDSLIDALAGEPGQTITIRLRRGSVTVTVNAEAAQLLRDEAR